MTELKRVRANDLEFAYLEEGSGPLVLLVHGFPDTAHSWDRTRPILAAAGYRAISPFTRGYAPTEIPREEAFDADTLGRDVLALITALGEERAILVGHDWGASACYSAAALDPKKVELLVTLAIPHPASVSPTPSMLWNVRHFYTLSRKNAAERVRANDFAMIDELVQRWSPAWEVPAGTNDEVKKAFREPGSLEAALGYYRGIRLSLPPGQRKRIEVPSVSFAGLNDNIDPSMYDKAKRRFTGSYEVVRVPGGHFMHLEHPEPFHRALLTVLAGRRG